LKLVKTNILGTENVLNAALVCGVRCVITLSTDKSVYPINAMGISKAMMEKLVVAKSRLTDPNKTTFCCTRYGNVMAHAEDLGDYYRITANNRDLNYKNYFIVGEQKISVAEDYNSINTESLNVEQIKEKLLTLDLVQEELKG